MGLTLDPIPWAGLLELGPNPRVGYPWVATKTQGPIAQPISFIETALYLSVFANGTSESAVANWVDYLFSILQYSSSA